MSSNSDLFLRACRVIPGGVNSPVRAFKAVGGTPKFITKAKGPHFWDAEGTQYTDYIGSWGPMILGHGHPDVLEAVVRAAETGFSFGAPTEREIELAEEILRHIPSMQMVRLVSSGTEAAMSAIRLARGATGRKKLIKFEGCYHGHVDSLLVKAGSGLAGLAAASSSGVSEAVAQETIVCKLDDETELENIFTKWGKDIAAVIVDSTSCRVYFLLVSARH